MKVKIALLFEKYIAHPFHRERDLVINITKASGYNRVRSESKRKAVLQAELEKRGLTAGQYEELVERANAPFFFTSVNNHKEVIIPARNVESFLTHVAHVAPRNVCPLQPQIVRTAIQCQPPGLLTGKAEADGTFGRFVKLEESNQRSYQENPYISDFTARGILVIDEAMIKPDDVRRMLEAGGRNPGMGAARSQNYGRFSVVQFEDAG